MRLISDSLATGPDTLVDNHAVADYVYMYPPRQAYRPVERAALDSAIARSLARPGPLDLYLHFPFCRQICAFCNLYAVVNTSEDAFEGYVSRLMVELDHYSVSIAGRSLSTIYLGGGTPSQLPARLFARIFTALEERYGCSVADVPEVAIEMAPDTATPERLRAYVEVGINRVNLGVQSTDGAELHGIGRRHGPELSLSAVKMAMDAGFRNVCVDLIYGLQGQDFASWRRSVDAVIDLGPQTVCAYALTLRPWTGFAARGYDSVDPGEQTAKYDYADAALQAAGYRQETHVRWARGPEGGYLQKENHWALGTILGVGAGARGYLWECDYRNGYSARHRARVLRAWYADVERYGHGRVDGFLMDDDERQRKAIVLGLHDLDRTRFRALFACDPVDLFPEAFAALVAGGYGGLDHDRFRLTASGMRHRDILVQMFISNRVRELAASTDYGE